MNIRSSLGRVGQLCHFNATACASWSICLFGPLCGSIKRNANSPVHSVFNHIEVMITDGDSQSADGGQSCGDSRNVPAVDAGMKTSSGRAGKEKLIEKGRLLKNK